MKNVFVIIPHIFYAKKFRCIDICVIPFAKGSDKNCHDRVQIKNNKSNQCRS